jgi:hypothetical protein
MRKIITLTCIMLLGVVFTQAQTTTTASGNEASGSGGTASYSVGQVAYQTHSGTNGSVAEGVQQAYEISVITGIDETAISLLNISAYPNPTTEFLKLKVDASSTLSIQELQYQLYDMQGKLLQSEKLTGNETQINMNNCVSATYFVRVISDNKSIKEFKIIKN